MKHEFFFQRVLGHLYFGSPEAAIQRDFLRKRCSENMQQICKRTPMSKCGFNKVAFQFCQYHCGHVIHEVKFLHNLSKATWHHVQNFKKNQSIPTIYVFMIYFLWKEQPKWFSRFSIFKLKAPPLFNAFPMKYLVISQNQIIAGAVEWENTTDYIWPICFYALGNILLQVNSI